MPSITHYVALYAVLAMYPIATLGQGASRGPRGPVGDAYTCETKLTACSLALRDAQQVIDDQDSSITGLKKANKELADRLADSQSAPLLPGWVYVVLGGVAGAVTYRIVTGH